MTVSTEQCRHSTSEEAVSKRLVELRPSRKRRREEAAPPGLDDGYLYPFGDDLSGMPDRSQDQRVYVHVDQGGGTRPEEPPAHADLDLPPDLFGSDEPHDDEPGPPTTTTSTALVGPPPGIPALPELPEDHARHADVPVGDATEDETENIPQSRQESELPAAPYELRAAE